MKASERVSFTIPGIKKAHEIISINAVNMTAFGRAVTRVKKRSAFELCDLVVDWLAI
jgi:hypothetical protein